jgi:hypothetical protein
MAINWHWAWGSETATTLLNYGFNFNSTATTAPDSTYVYTYTGSPTRYSMTLAGARNITFPAPAYPSTSQGWTAIPFRAKTISSVALAADIIRITGAISGRSISVQTAGDGKSLRLFVSNIFMAATPPYDWTQSHYIALRWDMSTTTWSGQIYVDEIAETAISTSTTATAAEVSGSVFSAAASTSSTLEWCLGQIICYDALTDLGYLRRFVTRVEPNADGTNIGTWTPSVGTTDWEVLDTPLNDATYTANAAPVALDRVEVLTNGGGSDLDTALGTTTTAIDSVLVHGFATGDGNTVRALVGDGTASETPGANVTLAIGAIYYPYAVANTKPSGGAWAGTDNPDLILEVVS